MATSLNILCFICMFYINLITQFTFYSKMFWNLEDFISAQNKGEQWKIASDLKFYELWIMNSLWLLFDWCYVIDYVSSKVASFRFCSTWNFRREWYVFNKIWIFVLYFFLKTNHIFEIWSFGWKIKKFVFIKSKIERICGK